MIFLYNVEFVPGENPPGIVDQFTDGLKRFAISHGLDLGMSALGGMVRRRGDVRRVDADVTEDDRQQLANWLRSQRVKCVVRLSDLEYDDGTNPLFREISELVFEVDNLVPEDRQAAAEWWARVRGGVAE